MMLYNVDACWPAHFTQAFTQRPLIPGNAFSLHPASLRSPLDKSGSTVESRFIDLSALAGWIGAGFAQHISGSQGKRGIFKLMLTCYGYFQTRIHAFWCPGGQM